MENYTICVKTENSNGLRTRGVISVENIFEVISTNFELFIDIEIVKVLDFYDKRFTYKATLENNKYHVERRSESFC